MDYAGQEVATRSITLKPSRKTTIYILPHSHTDIGYTELQTEIESVASAVGCRVTQAGRMLVVRCR